MPVWVWVVVLVALAAVAAFLLYWFLGRATPATRTVWASHPGRGNIVATVGNGGTVELDAAGVMPATVTLCLGTAKWPLVPQQTQVTLPVSAGGKDAYLTGPGWRTQRFAVDPPARLTAPSSWKMNAENTLELAWTSSSVQPSGDWHVELQWGGVTQTHPLTWVNGQATVVATTDVSTWTAGPLPGTLSGTVTCHGGAFADHTLRLALGDVPLSWRAAAAWSVAVLANPNGQTVELRLPNTVAALTANDLTVSPAGTTVTVGASTATGALHAWPVTVSGFAGLSGAVTWNGLTLVLGRALVSVTSADSGTAHYGAPLRVSVQQSPGDSPIATVASAENGTPGVYFSAAGIKFSGTLAVLWAWIGNNAALPVTLTITHADASVTTVTIPTLGDVVKPTLHLTAADSSRLDPTALPRDVWTVRIAGPPSPDGAEAVFRWDLTVDDDVVHTRLQESADGIDLDAASYLDGHTAGVALRYGLFQPATQVWLSSFTLALQPLSVRFNPDGELMREPGGTPESFVRRLVRVDLGADLGRFANLPTAVTYTSAPVQTATEAFAGTNRLSAWWAADGNSLDLLLHLPQGAAEAVWTRRDLYWHFRLGPLHHLNATLAVASNSAWTYEYAVGIPSVAKPTVSYLARDAATGALHLSATSPHAAFLALPGANGRAYLTMHDRDTGVYHVCDSNGSQVTMPAYASLAQGLASATAWSVGRIGNRYLRVGAPWPAALGDQGAVSVATTYASFMPEEKG